MLPVSHLLTALVTLQAPPAEVAAERAATAAERAAAAAERAAAAAERSAEANARLAEAIERLATSLERPAAAPEAPPAVPPATASAEKKPEEKVKEWTATVGLGLIVLTGNSSTITFNGLATLERKTAEWIYSGKAFGAYGRTRPPELEGEVVEEAQVVALNAGLQLRGDRRFTETFSVFLLAGADTDHLRSVELRAFGEAGASAIWWERKEKDRNSWFRTDLAFRFARERRFQYYPTREELPDVSIGGPRIGASLRYAFTKDVLLLEELSVLPSVLEGSRLLLSNQTQLSVRLTKSLAIVTTFLVQYDSEPAEGKVPTDTSLSVAAELAF